MPGARSAGISGLYAVTPDIADTALLVRKVAAAIRGGAAVVQYRNKAADAPLRLEQAAGGLGRLVGLGLLFCGRGRGWSSGARGGIFDFGRMDRFEQARARLHRFNRCCA